MAKAPLQADSTHNNSADTLIEQAWNARRAAYDRYNALPFSEEPGETLTPQEIAEWAIIDAAEEAIRSTIANTPRGAATKLWIAVQHAITDRPDEAAVLRRDLQWFADDDGQDWTVRLILSAIRSLEAMEVA